ncbi:PD-(D/E)XK nuclease-like domain-containing protein [Nocardioides marmoriginsengisoli]|uniref:PD-(D/E)XK nuclease-like domain-containing protein n=1 Tax=Nocardioides marmoriginsengisoli TaxID=661483 RepID=UPI00160C40D4|nr:PD-(D/E)XK nuclease-like domain-containing protein [Nocardioides marmoriginsengisoli]
MSAVLVRNLNEHTYHNDTTTLSASGAKILLGKRPPAPDSEALAFGRLVHTVILEPQNLDTYAVLNADEIGLTVKGEKSDNPKATKAWREAVFAAKRDGLTVIDPAELAHAQALADAIAAHPEAGRLLAAATEHELSAYAEHPSGARVRARFDLVIPGSLGDIKACRDADPKMFDRTVHALGYHISAANYIDIARANGLTVDRFDLICVEKEPTPGGEYRVAVMEIHKDAIEKGRELMADACARWLALGKCINLPSYGDGRHVVDLPPYVYNADFEDIQINLGEAS